MVRPTGPNQMMNRMQNAAGLCLTLSHTHTHIHTHTYVFYIFYLMHLYTTDQVVSFFYIYIILFSKYALSLSLI